MYKQKIRFNLQIRLTFGHDCTNVFMRLEKSPFLGGILQKEKNQCFPSFSHIQRKCFLFQMEKMWSCYIHMQISTILKPFQNKK